MKVVIKIVYICLSLMLILPVISAITEEEIIERLGELEVEDYEVQFRIEGEPKMTTRVGKSPNYFKEVVFKNGTLVWYYICYKDTWAAHYDEYTGYVKIFNYKGIFNIIKRFFGRGVCYQNVTSVGSDMTPERLLRSDTQKYLYVEFEEGIFEGRNTIKAIVAPHKSEEYPQGSYPLKYYETHYDKDTLFKIAQISYCNPKNNPFQCAAPNGTIEYTNITINKGILESEFELFMPAGSEICEPDLKRALILEAELEEIQESLFLIQGLTEKERIDKETKAMRKLTEEEYYHFISLRKEERRVWCRKPLEKPLCTYNQYLAPASLECQF